MTHTTLPTASRHSRLTPRAASRSLRLLLLSTASLWSATAHGQTAPAAGADPRPVQVAALTASSAPPSTVADVIVTATRQSTNLQKTPVAVTVIGADKVAAEELITARDLAGQVPGVTIERAGITPTTQVFFIRGIGDADPIFDPNVAQYVDDVYLPRAINGLTGLSDIERVEVLRGPQGTLFGENADAGAIRYITKNPTDDPAFNADVGYGTYNAFNFHGYASGPLIPGLLDGNIAFGHEQHDGFTYDPTLKQDVNNQNTTAARAKLLATLTPKLTVLLTLDGTRDTSGAAYYATVHPIIGGTLQSPVYGLENLNESYASQTPTNNSWTGGVSAKVSYKIVPSLTFNSITAFRGFAQDPVNYNNDGEPLVPYNNANPTLVTISDNYIVYRDKEATQEFQLIGKFAHFDFTGGLYFLYEDFSSNRIGYVASPTGAGAAPADPIDQVADTKTYNYAEYLQGDYHVTDKLTLTLGGRYTIETRDFNIEGITDNFQGTALGAPYFTYGDIKTWSSFTPKGGLSYQFTPGLFGYASVSEGFDAGGFNNRATTLAAALPYNQENVTTYELGLKSDLLSHRLRVDGTLFYNAYTNLQETASVLSPPPFNIYVSVRSNAPKAHTEGVELETTAEPIDGLSLTGNVSYLETRFDSFPNASNSGTVLISATGNQLPISPHWQLYGAANYRIPVNLPGDLRIGADITYESAYFTDLFNHPQGQIPDQGFSDAFISYAPNNSHWLFALTGRNLADRIAFQSLTYSAPNLWEGPVSPPRTVFFKITYTN